MISKKSFFSRGFTLIEMLVIVPVVILVIGIFISAIVSMTGDILAARGSNALSNNIQDALNRIEQDVNSSSGYLATNNIALTSPQGYDDGTASFDNVGTNGTMLILNSYATTSNPLNSNQSTIYTPSPNPCNSTQVNQNPPVMMNIIYFVKNGTLWRRVVAPYNYATIGCSVPWQQPSCTPGYATPSFCKTQDTRLVDNIQTNGFNVSYFINASSVSANATASDSSQPDNTRQTALQAANTVGVTINATGTTAGRNVSQSGTLRAVSPNNNIQPIVTNGLILNLDAGNPASYPGSGNTWNDISGNGNNGTLNGGTAYSSSDGGALSFNGSNSYVNITNNSQLQITGSSTIEFWIKPTNLAAGRQNIIDKTYGGEFAFTQETDGSISYFYGTSGVLAMPYQGFSTSPTVATQGQWQHFAIVRNLTNSKLYWYKNGVLVNSVAASYTAAAPTSNNINIGLGYTGVYYNGLISSAHIYNRALSAAEIQQNFNALSSRYNYQFVRALVIAGGGGGGRSEANPGGDGAGGGGAGGLIYNPSYSILQGSYSVTVGTGGSGSTTQTSRGSNGTNSVFGLYTAIGGGGGGTDNDDHLGVNMGASGGSGGGAANSYNQVTAASSATSGQGNIGAGATTSSTVNRGGSGGGGAGGVGIERVSAVGGAGGVGLANSITGNPTYYAGGGGAGGAATTGGSGGSGVGGAGGSSGGNGSVGVINTGSGGGGGSSPPSGNIAGNGGAGGSGVVIISYPTGSISATGGTITTSGGYTIHKFTSSGTFIVN